MSSYASRFSALVIVIVAVGIGWGAGCGSGRRAGAPLLSSAAYGGTSSMEAVLDSAAVVAAVRLVDVLPLSTLVQYAPGDTVLFRAVSEVGTVYAAALDLSLSPERTLPESGGHLTYTFLAPHTSAWRKAWPLGGDVLVALMPSGSNAFGRTTWQATASWPLTPELRAFVGGWHARREVASRPGTAGR